MRICAQVMREALTSVTSKAAEWNRMSGSMESRNLTRIELTWTSSFGQSALQGIYTQSRKGFSLRNSVSMVASMILAGSASHFY